MIDSGLKDPSPSNIQQYSKLDSLIPFIIEDPNPVLFLSPTRILQENFFEIST